METDLSARLGGFIGDTVRCSVLLRCSASRRPQKQRDGSFVVGINFLHRRRKKTIHKFGSFTGAYKKHLKFN